MTAPNFYKLITSLKVSPESPFSWHSVCTRQNQSAQEVIELTELGDFAGERHELFSVACLFQTEDRFKSASVDERFAMAGRQNYIKPGRCQLCR